MSITLATRIDLLAAQHGSLRAAARAIRLDAGYLVRLRDGQKTEPSAATLRKLGLKRVVTYRLDARESREKP